MPETSVLVTDQYAGYHFIDNAQRQLCWAHVALNVAVSTDSCERINHPMWARLVLLADTVFRTLHRWENGELTPAQYQWWLRRCRQRDQAQVELKILRNDDMLWKFQQDD